jgi:hypothetical protein
MEAFDPRPAQWLLTTAQLASGVIVLFALTVLGGWLFGTTGAVVFVLVAGAMIAWTLNAMENGWSYECGQLRVERDSARAEVEKLQANAQSAQLARETAHDRLAAAMREGAGREDVPPAQPIRDDVLRALASECHGLLERIAPRNAAVLGAYALQLDGAAQAQPDLFDLTQLQTLGIALYQCVEVLTMINAAAEEAR